MGPLGSRERSGRQDTDCVRFAPDPQYGGAARYGLSAVPASAEAFSKICRLPFPGAHGVF
ncbi:MAG: hypothetical protein JWL84_5547 [Rhodospirillales bacterium]|nr:hypothetical protein [Rhodospirillales bacterium]